MADKPVPPTPRDIARADQSLARLGERLNREVDRTRINRQTHPDPLVTINGVLRALDAQPPDKAPTMRLLLAAALVRLSELPVDTGLELETGDDKAARQLHAKAEALLESHLAGARDAIRMPGITEAGAFGCVMLALRSQPSTALLMGAAAMHRLAKMTSDDAKT